MELIAWKIQNLSTGSGLSIQTTSGGTLFIFHYCLPYSGVPEQINPRSSLKNGGFKYPDSYYFLYGMKPYENSEKFAGNLPINFLCL
jgi:hypothetical protein